MVTVSDIKEELNIEAADTSQDKRIQKVLKRIQNFIKGYCNNENINFDDTSDLENNPLNEELDEIVIYLTVMNLNPETSLRAGKAQESAGISISYIDDLPKYLKKALIKYKRVSFL